MITLNHFENHKNENNEFLEVFWYVYFFIKPIKSYYNCKNKVRTSKIYSLFSAYILGLIISIVTIIAFTFKILHKSTRFADRL